MGRLIACLCGVALVAGCGGPARPTAAVPAANVRIVAFWTPRLSTCHAMNPILDRYEKDTGRRIERLNVDENPELARKYEVTALPTVLVLDEDERMVGKVIGVVPIQTLTARLARHFEGAGGAGGPGR